MDSDQEQSVNLLTECIKGYVETNHTTSLNHDASNLISFIENHSERALLEACRNVRNKIDQSLVHVAAIAGHIQVLRALFVKLSDDDYLELLLVQDINDETPAIIASGLGNLEILTILMGGLSEQSCFSLLQLADGTYGTAVHHAALNNHSQVLDYVLGLISKDLATKLLLQTNVMGIVPLHWAVLKGHIESITSMLDILGAPGHAILLGAGDKHGVSVMLYAVKNEEMRVTETILRKVSTDQRSQMLQKSDKSGNTSLHHAACNPRPEVMNCIINSIDRNEFFQLVQKANLDDQTPLHLAARKGNVKVMRTIIHSLISHPQFTGLMQAEDDVYGTILHHASQCGSLHAVRCIVEALPVDVRRKLIKSTDAMGMTALHWAARSKQASAFEFIQTLLPQDEWVELLTMKDGGGESVMHTAANSQCDRMLEGILGTVTNEDWKMLLKLQDGGGKNPDALVCAACKDNLFLLIATMNSQADKASVSSYAMFCTLFYDGKSLLHTACCNGSVRVVEYILECLPPEKRIQAIQQQHHSGHTALHFAIESGSHELVNLFTKLVPEDNFMQLLQCNGRVGTPLHAAARSNKVVIAKCLLDSVPVERRIQLLSKHDPNKRTPLHSAACNANADMLNCIVGYCTQDECIQLLNGADVKGNNVLQCALKVANSFEVVQYSMNILPADQGFGYLMKVDGRGRTSLHLAAQHGNAEIMEFLLSFLGADQCIAALEQHDQDGKSILHHACCNQDNKLLKCLLDRIFTDQDSDFLQQKDKEGNTCFHLAAKNANTDHMRYLLQFIKADQFLAALEQHDQDGRSILHHACCNQDNKLLKCLLDRIPINQRFGFLQRRDKKGNTCFHLAAKNANNDHMYYLLQFVKADQFLAALEQHDQDERSILHHACCNQDNKLLKCLLDRNFTDQRFDFLQQRDKEGNTCFHLAAKNANTDHMYYLLQFINADQLLTALEQHDQDGKSMLHHACLKQDSKLMKSLLDRIPTDHRFNYAQKLDHKLQTPLHFAACNANADIVNCLVRYFSQNECNLLLKVADIDSNNVLQYALKVTSEAWWLRPSPNCSRKVSLEVVQCIMNIIPTDQVFCYLMKVDRRGRTSLHLAARYANPDVIAILLGFISANQRITAAELEDQEGQLLLHYACLNEDTKVAKTVLDTIPTEDHVRLLLIEDTRGVAAIHLAFFNVDAMRSILETTVPAHRLLNLLQKQSLLTITDSYHYQRQFDIMVLLKVFELFPDDLQFMLLKLRDNYGRTILHQLCETSCLDQSEEECINNNCIDHILQPLSSEQRIELLLMRDEMYRTCLHCLSSNNVSSQDIQDVMKLIHELVPADQLIQLLLAQDETGMTILHTLCAPGRYYIWLENGYIKGYIDCLLQPLSPEQRIQVLLMKDESDRTCMHYLSGNNRISPQGFLDVMKLIEELVPADQRIKLLLAQDESGMTILHRLCKHNDYDEIEEEYIKGNKEIYRHEFRDVMMLILELVPADQIMQLLLVQDASGMTILHHLCSHRYSGLMIKENYQQFLQCVPADVLTKLLLIQNQDGKTILHYFTERDQFYFNRAAGTIIDRSFQDERNTFLEYLVHRIPDDHLPQLFCMGDKTGKTRLHQLFVQDEEFVKMIFPRMPEDTRFKIVFALLTSIDDDHHRRTSSQELTPAGSSTHQSTYSGDFCSLLIMSSFRLSVQSNQFENLRKILDVIAADDEYMKKIFLKAPSCGQIAIRNAIDKNNTAQVQCIVKCLGNENTFLTFRATRYRLNRTVLHQAALLDYTALLRVLLDSITQKQRLSLLLVKDNEGLTAYDEAKASGSGRSMDILEEYLTDAQVELAFAGKLTLTIAYGHSFYHFWQQLPKNLQNLILNHVQPLISIVEGGDNLVQEVTEYAPMTISHIQRLSENSKDYIIPQNHKNAKCYGLVFYNPEGRDGAIQEAYILCDALQATCSNVLMVEWIDALDLVGLIVEKLEEIQLSDCCLLTVCIMTHGALGMLKGRGESIVPINDVLHALKVHSPAYLPMVVLIQACQPYRDLPSTLQKKADANRTPAPGTNNHVVLDRPHTALLLATVQGGYALRGHFTGAMANQFLKADGQTDIHEMFTQAVSNLKASQDGPVPQQPEFRSTLHKRIVLYSCRSRKDTEQNRKRDLSGRWVPATVPNTVNPDK